MDNFRLIIPIAVAALIFVLIVIVLIALFARGGSDGSRWYQRRRSEYKGAIGEEYVENVLKRCMVAGDKLLSNVILPGREEGDIDHILLSTRGFFVVETKNWTGDIYGDERSEMWQLVFSDGSGEERYSPFKQNNGHIFALKNFCGMHVWFENVIVFVQDNTRHIQSSCVFTLSELEQRLNSLENVDVRKAKERDELYSLLKQYATRIFVLS